MSMQAYGSCRPPSPFVSRSAVFPRQIHGERAPVCLCHPAELERAPETTLEMNQIHHCRQRGEEHSSTALMHQRWGFQWGQRIQTTPVHENYSDFIITRPALLEEGGGIPTWSSGRQHFLN